jgi:hypothetical protein
MGNPPGELPAIEKCLQPPKRLGIIAVRETTGDLGGAEPISPRVCEMQEFDDGICGDRASQQEKNRRSPVFFLHWGTRVDILCLRLGPRENCVHTDDVLFPALCTTVVTKYFPA